MGQIEITSPVDVLDSTGNPVNFGWACSSFFQYNTDFLRVSRLNVSESDRYIIFSPAYIIVFEILDSGFLAYASISVVPTKSKQKTSQIFTMPFSLGRFNISPNGGDDSIRIEQKKSFLGFISMEKGIKIIKTDIPKFGHQRRLRGEVVLFEPAGKAQSIITHAPWCKEKRAFRYSYSSPWYIVEGVMQFGTSEIVFSRGSAWGIFNRTSSVRPRSDTRFWASACGVCNSKQIAFNVGYGSEDSSAGTENAFFLDGKIHKLDQVTFHISPTDWLLPWHFTSNDNRLEMVFTPYQARLEHNQMLFHYIRSRQAYGFFSGKVVLDDGNMFEFKNLTGFTERRKTRF